MRALIAECLAVSLFLLAAYSTANAQALKPGEWRSYTAMREVTDLAATADSNAFWAVTHGGAFRIPISDPSVQGIKALRNTDGLSTNDLTAVGADKDGFVYFGGFSGAFNIYNERTGNVRRIADIELFEQFLNRQINSISIYGERVYLSTGYGITIYDKQRGSIGETIKRLGGLLEQSAVLGVVEARDKIFAVLAQGVASAPRGSLSLTKDSTWRIVNVPGGVTATSIATLRGRVVVGTTAGMYEVLDDRDTLVFLDLVGRSPIVELAANDSLFAIGPSNNGTLYSTPDLISTTTVAVGELPNSNLPTALALTHKAKAIGSSSSGVLLMDQTVVVDSIYPPGPSNSSINYLRYSQSENKLYTTHGGFGVSVFDLPSGNWFTHRTFPQVPAEQWKYILPDTVRHVTWLSGAGPGVARATNLDSEHPDVVSFEGKVPYTVAPSYTIAGAGMIDRDGRAVIPIFSATGNGLAITSDGETFSSIWLNPPGDYRSYGRVAQDLNGTFWVGTELFGAPPPYGVMYATEQGKTGAVAGGNNGPIPSPNVNAMLVDQDNGLWVGTDQGMVIISNLYGVTNGEPAFSRPVPLIAEQIIRDIAADGVGNKWVATDNGVFVVSADGADSIGHFTKENSPLVDNDVKSVSIDTKLGEAYLGTVKGISRVSTIFREGRSDYSGISVYPNPLIQSDDIHPRVFVRGLVAQSTVKIYTISGKLMATIDGSQLGEQVTWNGLDTNGRQLPSGIYLVSATSPQSSDRGQAKIAIVRK